jgi:hypothetical protein
MVNDMLALLQDIFHLRFRPEMKKAVNVWRVTPPIENPDAPPSLFAMNA